MTIKNAIIATACTAAAIAVGNVTSSLILTKIYEARSKEKMDEAQEFINNLNK